MMRTDAVRLVGGTREFKTSEDHDLYLRLAEIGRLANLPETLVHYRMHLASNVHNRDAESRRMIFTILQELRKAKVASTADAGPDCPTAAAARTAGRNWPAGVRRLSAHRP